MAEVLGLASSIITVVDLSAKVVKQCKTIIETARNAPKDLRNILVEVSSLKSALENLQFLTKIDGGFAEEVSNQNGLQNAVKGCGETLGDLVAQLGSLPISDSQQSQLSKRTKIRTAVAWTWKEATARKLINELLQYKTTITLGLLTQTSREIHETKVAVEQIHEFVTVSQISRTSKHVSKEIYDIYEMNHQPGLDVLKEALRELLCHMETVYLFVDAVDESRPRDELLRLLEDFVTDARFLVEYLFSDQIRQSKAAFFSLSETDTIDTFLGTVLDVASKTTVDSLNPNYWATFEDYCARAAWLATFTWESYIVQKPELWSSLTRVWLSSPCYFQPIGDIHQASDDPDFVKRRSDFLIEYTDASNLPTVQELLARTFVVLVLNSSLILAKRLLTENDTDPCQIFLGSAIEAIASTVTHAVAEPLKEAIPLLSGQVDKTGLALICIGAHFCPQCPGFETDDCCKAIQPLLQYTETSETLTYSMTPLQLAVYCYDYGATKALLENDIDPNVLGARHGEPLPIHLYEVEDWGSASPLHIVKHVGYGLRGISKSLLFLKSRQSLGDKIKDLLIGYGVKDFMRSPSA
ncbi:putative NACHT domain-containing protein [Seiridium unicorne]|uniref:NACHT domain-containing protein n=1 Tax=Seiridium unicorne TaxID=138068 RepID=A0ABR2UV74_9PEZI